MKTKIMFIAVALLILLFTAGCNVESRTDCLNNMNQVRTATNICRAVVTTGTMDVTQASAMGAVIYATHSCSSGWYRYVRYPDDPNVFAPDIDCALEGVVSLLAYRDAYDINDSNIKLDVTLPAKVKGEVTDEQLDTAKAAMDLSKKLFDDTMLAVYGPKDSNRVTRAVTIGWNSVDPAYYGGWSGNLPDCEFDATFAAEMFREYGIPTTTLLTEMATIESCKAALKYSLAGLKEGDWLIVWLSGHGGQVSDIGGDESDGLDEYICAYDGPVMDDTINSWLAEVPAGVCVLWICDTCHSGTMHRRPPVFRQKAVRNFDGQLILISGSSESGYSLSTGQGGVLSTALHDTGPEWMTPKTWYDAAKALIPPKTQQPQYVEYGDVTDSFRYGQIICEPAVK